MLVDTRILIPDIPAHYEGIKKSFAEMGLKANPITLHTSEGKLRAFEVSMTACIILATLKFIQSN